MRPPQRRHTLAQIVQARRWAWTSSQGDDQPDLYYDGRRFWQQPEGRVRRPALAQTLPRDGWWHAKDCLCELCRPRGGV